MGVIWREFGDGVSMSERYLRMWIGVLPVLGSLPFGNEGLMKSWGSSGGVRFKLSLTAKLSDNVCFSSKTFSEMRQKKEKA